METAFTQATTAFLNTILRAIATDVIQNPTVTSLTVDALVDRFRTQVGVPTAPAIPSALASLGAAPGQIPGLSAMAPAKKARGSGGKKAKELQQWLSMDQYRALHAEGRPVCAYVPNRGDGKKGMVCCAPATNTEKYPNDPLEWRCDVDINNKGQIQKFFSASQGKTPSKVVAGFNVPGLPMFNTEGSLPAIPLPPPTSLPGLPTALPALPGLPAPVVTLPSLPTLSKPVLEVIAAKDLPGISFIKDAAYRCLALMETPSKEVYCIGKVSGFTPEEDTPIPADWFNHIGEPSAEDFAYLKSLSVLYNFKNKGTPAPIA